MRIENKLIKLLPNCLKKFLPRKMVVISLSEAESRKFNQKYRKKATPTNVLSFCYGPDYGEILVCPAVIRREAKVAGNTYKYQMTWMILHGILHLAGLHHEKSSAVARKVERIEGGVLRNLTAK